LAVVEYVQAKESHNEMARISSSDSIDDIDSGEVSARITGREVWKWPSLSPVNAANS
jgi:hypothetical protein